MAPSWDPRATFGFPPSSRDFHYTCFGTTLKNERCRNAVNVQDRLLANRILNVLAAEPVTSTDLNNRLGELSELCLCKRYHRKTQITDTVTKWNNIISQRFPGTMTSATSRSRRTLPITEYVASPPSSQLSSRSPRTLPITASVSSSPSSQSSPQSRRTLPITEPITSPPSTQSSSRSPRTLPISASIASPPSSQSSPQQYHRTRTASTSPVQPLLPQSTTQTPRLGSTQGSASAAHQTPHRHVVTRKPITEDCGICCEPINSIDDAVWCQKQCGQNVHRECFKTWKSTCVANTRIRSGTRALYRPGWLKCVYCRQDWLDDEWSDDEWLDDE